MAWQAAFLAFSPSSWSVWGRSGGGGAALGTSGPRRRQSSRSRRRREHQRQNNDFFNGLLGVKADDKLTLVDCDIVSELNGKTFDDLGTALQIRLKRAFVRVEVIRRESDPKLKYYMFKRLNTGGERLTPQQIRNCTIRLLDPKFNDFIIELSKEPDFVTCTEGLTEEQRLGAFDQELVLRFFALKNARDRFKHDVSDFLTDYMEAVSDPSCSLSFDFASEKAGFLKTLRLLAATLGDRAFAYANPRHTELTRGFSVYHYEALNIGLQKYLGRMDPEDAHLVKKVGDKLREVKLSDEFIRITTGGGKNSPGPLQERIGFVEQAIGTVI